MYRQVLRIALPMILSNLTIPLLGLVDTAVIGHLPKPQYLGAVAVGTTIFNFLFLGLNFLRMGTTGLTAQVYGRNDADTVRAALGQSVLLALALAAILLTLQIPLERLAIWLIHPSADVAAYAGVYFRARIWAAPAVLVNYSLLGWFLGMQNARVPMAMLITISGANIALDLFFVLGLNMNVAGVAWGSVGSESIGTALACWRARRLLQHYPGVLRRSALFDKQALRRLAGVNVNILIRTLALMFAFGFFTAQGAQFGDVVLAANALLLNFQNVMSYGLDGFAHAVEALSGRAIGAGSRHMFDRAVRAALTLSLGLGLAFALIYSLGGNALIRLLTSIRGVRLAAAEYLPWMIVSPLFSVWPFLFDGIFIGATRAKEMRNAMLIATFLCYLPAWYFTRSLANHGLWLAFMVFLAARGLTMALAYPSIRRSSFDTTTAS